MKVRQILAEKTPNEENPKRIKMKTSGSRKKEFVNSSKKKRPRLYLNPHMFAKQKKPGSILAMIERQRLHILMLDKQLHRPYVARTHIIMEYFQINALQHFF